MKHNRFWTAIAALLALVATACGSSSGGDATAEVGSDGDGDAAAASATSGEADGDGDAESDDDAAAPAVDGDGGERDGGEASDGEASDGDGETSSLETSAEEMSVEEITELLFPTFDQDSFADQEAQWQDQERQAQAYIAECMAAEGFEYTPVDYGSQISFGGADEGLDYNSREYAETYGFGYFTFDFSEEEEAFDGSEFVDPNADYVDGLSEGAQEAYDTALYGEQPDFSDFSEEEIEQAFEENPELFGPKGCEGEAWEATNEFAKLGDVYNVINDQLDDLYARVESDPRIAEWQREWAECMTGKGHAYTTIDEIYDALNVKSEEVYGNADFVDPFEGLSDEEIDAQIDSMTDEELDDLYGFSPDEELLAAAQEFEIALAVDSWDCGGASQWEEWEEIFAEYQETFIEENLDAIRAALASAG